MQETGLVTESVLADALDLTVETVRKYSRENKIPYIELPSGEYRYQLDAVIFALTGELPFYKKKPEKEYTYHDYLEIPSQPGHRFEILEGRLLREPTPTVMHQRISVRLVKILDDYFHKLDPRGEIFTAPMNTTLQDTTVVQPDILYVSGQQKNIIKDDRIDGAPTLIVEITSPATRAKDSYRKLQIYLRAGVQHYWLVDPQEQSLHCFALRDDRYSVVALGMKDDVVEHPDFAGLTINIGSLWINT